MQLSPFFFFDSECATQTTRLRATLEASGTPNGLHNMLIDTAARQQATLVRRNICNFCIPYWG